MTLDPQFVDLGVRLAESMARNTATSIATRIKTAKTAKQDREAIAELEQIIADLSEDRNELVQIAQAYKEQLVAQTISDADLEFITGRLVPMIKELTVKNAGPQGIDSEGAQEMIDLLSPLLAAETLTILQLLGFNFKKAIGEPLTDLVAQAISSRTTSDPRSDIDVERLNAQRELAYLQLAMDEEAFARFRSLIPNNPAASD